MFNAKSKFCLSKLEVYTVVWVSLIDKISIWCTENTKKEKKMKFEYCSLERKVLFFKCSLSGHFHIKVFTRPAVFLALGNTRWNYFKSLLLLVYCQWILIRLSKLHFDSWKCGIYKFSLTLDRLDWRVKVTIASIEKYLWL